MNLKKTVASLFAATAIVGSMFAPVYADESNPTRSRDTNASTNEVGTTENGHFWKAFNFGEYDVSNTSGDSYSVNDNTLTIRDNRADSSGWTVQVSASNTMNGTTNPEAFIEAKQLTIAQWGNAGFQDQCYQRDQQWVSNPVNPSNDYYNAQYLLDGVAQPLDEPVTVMKVEPVTGATRACGGHNVRPEVTLTVLPGQQIDSYTGTITVTTIWGEPTAGDVPEAEVAD